VLLFGVLGVACKILGWNRVVLILALAGGGLLEENIRRAMLISRGDPTVFVRWPFSATLVLLACCILLSVVFVSARPAPARGRETA
jgi:TctA family transporter